ncbi:MAG: transposase [Myxococcales bacterium]|nr:MAG: transposase [Myxococcales bacterium]
MRPQSGMRVRRFADELKEAAVERFLTSDLSLSAVAEQFGTTRYSVANWVKLAQSRGEVKKPKPHLVAAATPTDERSASEKLRLIISAGALSEEQLGEFLRREGLRDGDLERFRTEALGGLEGKVHSAQDRRQIQELERVNAKQAKRLREAEVLLELQKKVQELWGAKDDDTTRE